MSRVGNALDRRLRKRLPRPAYNHLLLNHQRLQKVARRSPGRGRLLPEFVIIGAAKAGTTSLYGWLTASYDSIAAETRTQLSEYFRPHNERLYELLGIDFGWETTTRGEGVGR